MDIKPVVKIIGVFHADGTETSILNKDFESDWVTDSEVGFYKDNYFPEFRELVFGMENERADSFRFHTRTLKEAPSIELWTYNRKAEQKELVPNISFRIDKVEVAICPGNLGVFAVSITPQTPDMDGFTKLLSMARRFDQEIRVDGNDRTFSDYLQQEVTKLLTVIGRIA